MLLQVKAMIMEVEVDEEDGRLCDGDLDGGFDIIFTKTLEQQMELCPTAECYFSVGSFVFLFYSYFGFCSVFSLSVYIEVLLQRKHVVTCSLLLSMTSLFFPKNSGFLSLYYLKTFYLGYPFLV